MIVYGKTHELVDRAMSVMLSSTNLDQLKVSIEYARLVYRKLSKEKGVLDRSGYYPNVERAIGYALCKIKNIQMDNENEVNKKEK